MVRDSPGEGDGLGEEDGMVPCLLYSSSTDGSTESVIWPILALMNPK